MRSAILGNHLKIFGRIPEEGYLQFSRINFEEVWLNQLRAEQVSKDSHSMSVDRRHFVAAFVWNYLL